MLSKDNNIKQTFIFSQEDLSILENYWDTLENIFDSLIFEKAEYGDTAEEVSVAVKRVKKPSSPIIYDQKLYDIISNEKLSNFLKEKLGMKKYYIDRLQVHKYVSDDYNSMHCDAESCSDYNYTLVLHLNDNYEGGEFRVKDDDDKISSFKLKKFSLLATDCRLPHEVAKVISGIRKVIVWFVSEKDLTINIPVEADKVA